MPELMPDDSVLHLSFPDIARISRNMRWWCKSTQGGTGWRALGSAVSRSAYNGEKTEKKGVGDPRESEGILSWLGKAPS